MSLVLVVASSHVDRLVLSRMVQAIGLKASSSHPDDAGVILDREVPCMIVIDGDSMGGGNADLLRDVARRREASPQTLPILIGLGNNPETTDAHVPDAVVSKPIIGEVLQSQISRLLERTRQ